jgi:hypothetical protein
MEGTYRLPSWLTRRYHPRYSLPTNTRLVDAVVVPTSVAQVKALAALARKHGPGPPEAVSTANRFCMAFLYGGTGCLAAQNGGFRPPRAAFGLIPRGGGTNVSNMLEVQATMSSLVPAYSLHTNY